MTLEDGTFMYCLWIAKDTIDIDKKYGTLTLATSDEGGAKNESLGEVRNISMVAFYSIFLSLHSGK